MPFTTLLTATALLSTPYILPAQTSYCDARKKFRTAVNYEFVIQPTDFVYTMPRAYLTHQGRKRMKDWVAKNRGHAWISGMGGNPKMHVEGVNTGSLRVESNVELIAEPYDRYGVYYCPYVRKLDVRVIYHSEIAIAREIKRGTCKFNAVMEHEMRHHDTNVTVAETLVKRMEADTPAIIDTLERYYVSVDDVQARYKDMMQGVQEALNIYAEEISSRHEEFNAYVDSPEEYKRVSELCPND